MEEVSTTAVVDDAWSLTIPEFKPEDNPHRLLEESSFSTVFPQYREKYLKECWPLVEKIFENHFVKAELDLRAGTMTVRTTRKTWDPYIIVKARDMIKLLSRSVPLEQAKRVLEDEIGSDMVKIGSMVKSKEKFLKRRQRLIGPAGCTLKSIELLSSCYLQVQGQTVCVVGPYKGIAQARRVIEDTMKNVHPIYNIKALMIKRELAKDPKLKDEDWSRFLPQYKSKTVANPKKKKKIKNKGAYTPFPPPQQESKVDKLLESGEYFLTKNEKDRRKREEIKKRQDAVALTRKEERNIPFIPPVEPSTTHSLPAPADPSVDITALKQKIKKSKINLKLKNK